MIKLIALTGPAQCGKSSIGAMLYHMLSGYVLHAFATPIKLTVNAMFDWDARHADGALKDSVDPEWGFSPRHAYQTFGTEWGRRLLRDDIWIKYMEYATRRDHGSIITDLRFENEASWVRQRGGLVVHVVREGDFGITSQHESEQGIAPNAADWKTLPCKYLYNLRTEARRIVHHINPGAESK